jgi:uncharacterized membrane protein
VLAEVGSPPSPKDVAARSKAPQDKAAPAKKKQVSNAQLMSRINWLITLGLIFVVLYFAVQYFMAK